MDGWLFTKDRIDQREWIGCIQPCTSGILYNYEYYYIWHLRGVDTKI